MDYELQDEQLEIKVLATFLQEPKSREYIKRLLPQVFYLQDRRILYNILKELLLSDKPINVEYIASNFPKQVNALDLITIYSDSRNLLDKKTLEWAVEHLKELYFSRITRLVAGKIINSANDRDAHLTLKISASLPKAFNAIFRSSNGQVSPFEQAVHVINSTDEYVAASFSILHRKIGGWTRSDISSIGGKSGHCKTTFALFEGAQGVKDGLCKKLLYFAVDEPSDKIARRIIANDLDISLEQMRQKKITLDKHDVERSMRAIYGDRLIIIDNLFDADKMYQAILDIKPERVILDHIQELDYGDEGISDQKVTVASKKLKEAARITKANVTIITQVRDKLIDERFEDKIPRPHDFLYASDLRRKSREQCVVYWGYKDSEEENQLRNFDFIVWKSSYSDTFRFTYLIEPDKARFKEKQHTKHSTDAPRTEEDAWKKIGEIGT